VIKINPVVLELPDDKRKTFSIDYRLRGVWMANVYSLKHFMLDNNVKSLRCAQKSSVFQTTAFLIHPKRVAIDYLV
jgi:hypothetical protein